MSNLQLVRIAAYLLVLLAVTYAFWGKSGPLQLLPFPTSGID